MHRLAVSSHQELVAALRAVDISVPACGATEVEKERWSIARFLATFGDTELIRYPLTVAKGERPDYHLTSQGAEIGIEVTDAISKDFAHFNAVRLRGESDIAFVDISLFPPGGPKRSSEELHDLLTAPLHGPGWAGDAAEGDWAEAMETTILAKAERAKKDGFTLYECNWLLIYDNWGLPVAQTLPQSVEFLFERLAGRWLSIVFSDLFIERGESFLHVSAPSYSIRVVNNVWRKEGVE